MEKMLLCSNSQCRFLLDLRGAGPGIAHTHLVLDGCPECGDAWPSRCPSCSGTLSVTWSGHHAHCAACGSPLSPQKSRTQSRAA